MYPAMIIPMANTKHATNDNTSGTVSLVYFVMSNEDDSLSTFESTQGDLIPH